MSFLGFTRTRLGLKDTPMKNPEDLLQLEPRTPRLRVKYVNDKYFTTEPREPLKSPHKYQNIIKGRVPAKKGFQNGPIKSYIFRPTELVYIVC